VTRFNSHSKIRTGFFVLAALALPFGLGDLEAQVLQDWVAVYNGQDNYEDEPVDMTVDR